jgi:RNA 2',3'-cyclic 3'-phosphodiesterase
MMAGSVRTFISVHIPDTVRRDLSVLIGGLRPHGGADVKWVRPESLHLTLKFLGDVEQERIGAVGEEIGRAVSAHPAFDMVLGGTGAFPNSRRPSVLWIGVRRGAGPLASLAGAVETALAGLGFEREKRPFSAHLTLARVRPSGNAGRIVERMAEAGFECDPFRIDSVHVMKSDLQRSGASYTTLRTLKLQG